MNLTETQVGKACERASDLIYRGQFEKAKEDLGELWPGPGNQPMVNFNPRLNAELLLLCGILTGWLGSAKQIDVQEKAMNLITGALEIFQGIKNQKKVAECRYELGMCYWRIGAFDEARIVLEKAMELATNEQRGKILVRQTLVEGSMGRYLEALQMLEDARSDFETYSHAAKGKWHGQKAIILRRLASIENRNDYYDRAIVEYTAASIHLEQAGHYRYQGNILNNLAFILCRLGQYSKAHEHLNQARGIFETLKDTGNIVQVEETKARVLLGEERYSEAESVINEVVKSLEKSGRPALLVEALTTQATIQSRLENKESISTFNGAIKIGEEAGSLCHAGLAAIGLIEEHGMKLSAHEIFTAYQTADRLLAHVQDLEHIDRLRMCARIFSRRLGQRGGNFLLTDAVKDYEAHFIQQALEEENGSITRAARKLGITHQGLAYILDNRQLKFFDKRTKPRQRRKSVFTKKV